MKVKAIFHIDELDKWILTLKNVENLINEIDVEKSKIEIIVNAEAVKYYMSLSEEQDQQLKDLTSNNIIFIACNNALRGLDINQEKLPDYIKIVPAGVFEIVKRQHEGFAYIKP